MGRMALLVTLFLVLVNIFNAITNNSPKADGLNALQGWVLTCIFFVFGSLLEYSVILLHLKIYSLSLALPNSSGTIMNTQALMSAALPATNAMSGNGSAPPPPKQDALKLYNEKM